MHRRLPPDVVDLLLIACSHNLRVLRYVHLDGCAWKRAFQAHIVTTPAPSKYYHLKVQWAATLYAIVQPYLEYEDVLAIVSYNSKLMMHEDVLVGEKEKRIFERNSAVQYAEIVSKLHKRTRSEAGFL